MTLGARFGSVVCALAASLVPQIVAAQRWPAHGEHRALPCRPTIACTADLVQDGAVEIELGVMSRRIGIAATQYSTPYLLKLTLASWVQIQLSGNGWVTANRDARAQYFDDVVVGPKFHLWNQSARVPSVSVSAEFGAPTWTGQLGYLRTYDAFATAYVTKDFGWLHADLNFGLNVWRVESSPIAQGFVALALSASLPDDLGVMLEGYFFSDALPVNARDGGILSAVTWSPRSWLTFDVGTDLGWFRLTRQFSVFSGVTVIVADLWDTEIERHLLRRHRPQ
jgi:hypothetical protein